MDKPKVLATAIYELATMGGRLTDETMADIEEVAFGQKAQTDEEVDRLKKESEKEPEKTESKSTASTTGGQKK